MRALPQSSKGIAQIGLNGSRRRRVRSRVYPCSAARRPRSPPRDAWSRSRARPRPQGPCPDHLQCWPSRAEGPACHLLQHRPESRDRLLRNSSSGLSRALSTVPGSAWRASRVSSPAAREQSSRARAFLAAPKWAKSPSTPAPFGQRTRKRGDTALKRSHARS